MISLYPLARVVAKCLTFFYPVRVVHPENSPLAGPCILCANHQSLRDPLILGTGVKPDIHYMAKKELFHAFLLGAIVKRLGAYPVGRGERDLAAIRTTMQLLKDGNVIGIFPQGHRYPDNEPHTVENGTAMIALRAGVPVIPVFISGPYRLFHRMTMEFAAPVMLDDLHGKYDAETLNEATRRIVEGIWHMKKAG